MYVILFCRFLKKVFNIFEIFNFFCTYFFFGGLNHCGPNYCGNFFLIVFKRSWNFGYVLLFRVFQLYSVLCPTYCVDYHFFVWRDFYFFFPLQISGKRYFFSVNSALPLWADKCIPIIFTTYSSSPIIKYRLL